jgi:hypothetical protein
LEQHQIVSTIALRGWQIKHNPKIILQFIALEAR